MFTDGLEHGKFKYKGFFFIGTTLLYEQQNSILTDKNLRKIKNLISVRLDYYKKKSARNKDSPVSHVL